MSTLPRVLIAVLSVLALSVVAACGSPDSSSPTVRAASSPTSDGSDLPVEAKIIHAMEAGTILIRTDFTDDEAWKKIVAVATGPDPTDSGDSEDGPYEPNIGVVDDKALDGWTASALTAGWSVKREGGYVLLADARSMAEEKAGGVVTVDVLDLSVTPEEAKKTNDYVGDPHYLQYGRAFRSQIQQVPSIEANLSIDNMDFSDFADDADTHHGVFTGFPDSSE